MANQFSGINKVLHSETLHNTKKGAFRELFHDWKWIFRYTKRHTGIVVLYTIAGLVSSSTALLVSYVMKMLINAVAAKQMEQVGVLAVIFGISIIADILISSGILRLSAKITIYIRNDIQANIFERVMNGRWSDIAGYANGDILNRFNDDVQVIANNAVNWIPNIIINIYTFTVTFILLWRMDYIMAIISIASAPVLLLVSRYFISKLREQRKKVAELNSNMMSFESESFSNYDMIKSFGIIRFYIQELRNWHKNYHDQNMEYNKVEIKARISMSVMSALVLAVAFGYSLYRLASGTLLFGDMTFFLTQRSNVSERFNSIVTAFPQLLNSAVSAQRIRELTDLPSEKHDSESARKLSEIAEDGITVELNDVSFAYNESRRVYMGCDFRANPGEIVTVLGSSGEGKTTLIRLILGLVTPESGGVTLCGSNGEKIEINADLRELISYVPQGNTLVSGSILFNMQMVKEDATEEEIIDALKTACAWEFVEKLPDGIHSKLGENARGVSMGQAQRISIARALLRNSPILMLDEATSALDIETENKVLKNIVSRCPNKTCIVSTHRPSIIAQSDRIYQVKDKKLIEMEKEEVVRQFVQ